jgi:CRP-like cAMP-binding protein
MAVLYNTQIEKYEENAIIFAEHSPALGVYILKSGHARAYREVAIDGKTIRMELGDFGPGALFGEMGLIEERTRSASVVALKPTTCLILPKKLFNDEFAHMRPWMVTMVRLLVLRLRETTNLLERQVAAHGELVARPIGDGLDNAEAQSLIKELTGSIENLAKEAGG